MQRKKELLQKIEELNAKIERLEECIKTQDRLIEGYQKREKAVIGALDTVETSVSRRLQEADEQAERVRTEAEAESKRLLKEVQLKAAELNDRVTSYNALLERAAADAARNAEFFSVFAKNQVLPSVEEKLAAGGVTPLLESDEPNPKTAAADDPKRLMQTIYSIERRDIPPVETPQSGTGRAEAKPGKILTPEERTDPEDELPVPKVSELLGKDKNEIPQDSSLESLLNEIIQTGDIL